MNDLAFEVIAKSSQVIPPLRQYNWFVLSFDFQVFKTLQDVHEGLEGLSRTATVLTSSTNPLHLSCPKPLRSDNIMDSLSREFSKLGPQEDTFCSSHNHSFPRPPSAATCSEPGRRDGSWDSRCSSFHVPCESDESQGYSQDFVSTCSPQRNTSQMWPDGNGRIKGAQSSCFSIVRPMPSGVASGKKKDYICNQQKFSPRFPLSWMLRPSENY